MSHGPETFPQGHWLFQVAPTTAGTNNVASSNGGAGDGGASGSGIRSSSSWQQPKIEPCSAPPPPPPTIDLTSSSSSGKRKDDEERRQAKIHGKRVRRRIFDDNDEEDKENDLAQPLTNVIKKQLLRTSRVLENDDHNEDGNDKGAPDLGASPVLCLAPENRRSLPRRSTAGPPVPFPDLAAFMEGDDQMPVAPLEPSLVIDNEANPLDDEDDDEEADAAATQMFEGDEEEQQRRVGGGGGSGSNGGGVDRFNPDDFFAIQSQKHLRYHQL